MTTTGPSPTSQVNADMRTQPPAARKALKQVRATVRATGSGAIGAKARVEELRQRSK